MLKDFKLTQFQSVGYSFQLSKQLIFGIFPTPSPFQPLPLFIRDQRVGVDQILEFILKLKN